MKGNGTLDIAGGASVELEFGVASQDSLSNNPTVGEQRFVWSLDKEGTRGVPGKGPRTSRAASEPACPYDEALNKGVASGLTNRMLGLRYEYSAEREKSVWILQAADDPKVMRVFDAYSCAILGR
jgi:hypothetical protein